MLWISVLLHNKSLLNKCKADGTVVSPPCGGKEREKKGEKRRKKEKKNPHAYSLFSSSTDTLIVHITQTVTVLSYKTLNPGAEVKGGVWILTDTQTHSVHEREHFVYRKGLSACLLILMTEQTFLAPAHMKKT